MILTNKNIVRFSAPIAILHPRLLSWAQLLSPELFFKTFLRNITTQIFSNTCFPGYALSLPLSFKTPSLFWPGRNLRDHLVLSSLSRNQRMANDLPRVRSYLQNEEQKQSKNRYLTWQWYHLTIVHFLSSSNCFDYDLFPILFAKALMAGKLLYQFAFSPRVQCWKLVLEKKITYFLIEVKFTWQKHVILKFKIQWCLSQCYNTTISIRFQYQSPFCLNGFTYSWCSV